MLKKVEWLKVEGEMNKGAYISAERTQDSSECRKTERPLNSNEAIAEYIFKSEKRADRNDVLSEGLKIVME
jgi:hypothetical protein